MLDQLALDEGSGFVDDLIEFERYGFHVGFFRKRANAPDHVAGTAAVVDYPFHRPARGGKIGLFTVKPAQRCLRIGNNRGKWLVYFMGYRCRQLAKHGHSRHMCELGLRRPEVLFGLLRAFQGSDFGTGAPIAEEVAVDIEERLAAGSNIDPGAAVVDDAIDKIPKRPVGIKRLPVPAPFFRLGLKIGCDLPPRHARQAGGHEASNIDGFRYSDDSVVRAGLPKPV